MYLFLELRRQKWAGCSMEKELSPGSANVREKIPTGSDVF